MPIVFLEQTAASVATPSTGKVAVFVDSATGEPSYKDDAGVATSLKGATGAAGPTGATGQGVPTGGTAGQVLQKVDGTDYNTVWAAPTGGVTSVNGATGAVIVPQPIIIACSDETTALTTGTAKVTFRMPYAFTLTGVRASVTTAPAGAVLTVDINEGGASILSTKLTIDAGEKTSTTAAAAAVISDAALADDAEITIDIDTVGSTVAGAGLKVTLIGYKP